MKTLQDSLRSAQEKIGADMSRLMAQSAAAEDALRAEQARGAQLSEVCALPQGAPVLP